MSFTFTQAVRENVALLIGIAGPSGAGKTLSALKIARGLAGGRPDMTPEQLAEIDRKIAVIDTEAGRARHYAPTPGELPGPHTFGFMHVDLAPPFTPERYIEAIVAADKAGFAAIMVDSMTHEYNGEGGIAELKDEEVRKAVEKARKRHADNGSRYPFDEDKEAEKASVGAWNTPKSRHKKMMGRLLQCRAHLLLLLRAEEKLRMEQVEEQGSNGKTYKRTVITQPKDLPPHERWVPVQEKSFMFELGLSILLTPDRPGYPIPVKLQEQHKPAVQLDCPLDERTGLVLSAWARGGARKKTPAEPPAEGKTLLQLAEEAARNGTAAYEEFFKNLSKVDRKMIASHHERLKSDAAKAKGVAA